MKSKKIDEAWIRKGKEEKILKDREEGGEVGKWWDKGGLPRAHMGQVENENQDAENRLTEALIVNIAFKTEAVIVDGKRTLPFCI